MYLPGYTREAYRERGIPSMVHREAYTSPTVKRVGRGLEAGSSPTVKRVKRGLEAGSSPPVKRVKGGIRRLRGLCAEVSFFFPGYSQFLLFSSGNPAVLPTFNQLCEKQAARDRGCSPTVKRVKRRAETLRGVW